MGEDNTINKITSGQVIPNPTGKGGFKEHPENRSPGGLWNPEMTFSFQYKKFLHMEVEDFKKWKEENKNRTMVQELAWNAVLSARNGSRNDRQEITNRTEGMPKQVNELSGVNGIPLLPTSLEDLKTNYANLADGLDRETKGQGVENDAPVLDKE